MVTITLPVNAYFGNVEVTIGDRLKEERARLGMNQPDFAAIAGTTKKSQITYEKGVMPDAGYLAAIAQAGADVQYIVTGERRGEGIGESAVHQAVLDAVDLLSLEKKVDAQQLAKAVVKLCKRSGDSEPGNRSSKFNITTNHGQVVEGGLVNSGGISFGVGASPKSQKKR